MTFLQLFAGTPALLFFSILTTGVLFVNGWTDAPNAIATCVATRAIRPLPAVAMAAVCNFLGLTLLTSLNASVAMTVYRLVDLGADPVTAQQTLCAAMTAIVIWAVLAWYFGIPTSESHALLAGLSGAVLATGGLRSLHPAAWGKVLLGLFASAFLGFLLGYLCCKLTAALSRNRPRAAAGRFFRGAQAIAGAATAFLHGAQDGQKFLGLFLLGLLLNRPDQAPVAIPLWLMLFCAAVMSIGTCAGGFRIIKAVGMDMVKLEDYQGFSADTATAACLLLSSLLGIPVSTTHTKVSAMLGAGAARRLRSIRPQTVSGVVLAWLFTFPGCGLLGYLTAIVFRRLCL